MNKIIILVIVFLFVIACVGGTNLPGPSPTEPLPESPEPISLPVIDSPQLTQFQFFNENDGWGVTDSKVVRTNDGGLHWLDATPAVSAQLGYAPFLFLDAHTAWMLIPGAETLTGTLYHTEDGGISWESAAVPFAYASLQFLDAQTGWAFAALGAGAGSEAVALFQTSDAGGNWQRVYINDPTVSGADDSLPLGGQKYGFAFLDTSRGWVGGSAPIDNYIYLYRTTDGGMTWSEVNLALPAGYESGQTGNPGPRFFSATEGILVVSLVMPADPGLVTVVYRTTDGGETWTPGQVIPSGRPTQFSTFLDGYAWGGGQFYITHDSGQTWTTFMPGEDFSALLSSFQFISSQVGWVLTTNEASDPSLYKTIDGGVTWSLLIP